MTKNLSTRGAYFVTKTPPNPGDVLVVTAGSLRIRCRVRRGDETSKDLRGFAVTFLPVSKDEEQGQLAERVPLSKAWSFELKELAELRRPSRPDIKRVLDYVEEHFPEKITLRSASKVAVLEATYFSALFHQIVGITFSEWLQYVRVRRALRIMNEEDCTISEIAYAVGFSNLRTFERTFKKWTNMNPRTFAILCRPDPMAY